MRTANFLIGLLCGACIASGSWVIAGLGAAVGLYTFLQATDRDDVNG